MRFPSFAPFEIRDFTSNKKQKLRRNTKVLLYILKMRQNQFLKRIYTGFTGGKLIRIRRNHLFQNELFPRFSTELCVASFATSQMQRSEHHCKTQDNDASLIVERIRNGNRGALASAITLMETEHKEKKKLAKDILKQILSSTEAQSNQSLRIGISGPPGAGKSTFIEIFGKYLTTLGHKIAVLAVDPSSATTGGSLLGDKTRMPELTKDSNAYIRPSPARGHLGGVTRSTNESIILCEFAGYDIIIVETVGVGQSEYAVTNMVDVFVLLLPPGGGDELQGIKRGIIERADLIVITKSDGDLEAAAQRARYEYMASLKYMRPINPNWKTKVMQVSAKTKQGIELFWETLNDFRAATHAQFMSKRGEQRVVWAWTHVNEGLRELILEDARIKSTADYLIEQVRLGKENPGTAADKILENVMSFIKS